MKIIYNVDSECFGDVKDALKYAINNFGGKILCENTKHFSKEFRYVVDKDIKTASKKRLIKIIENEQFLIVTIRDLGDYRIFKSIDLDE